MDVGDGVNRHATARCRTGEDQFLRTVVAHAACFHMPFFNCWAGF